MKRERHPAKAFGKQNPQNSLNTSCNKKLQSCDILLASVKGSLRDRYTRVHEECIALAEVLARADRVLVLHVRDAFWGDLKPCLCFSQTRRAYYFTNALLPSSLPESKPIIRRDKWLATSTRMVSYFLLEGRCWRNNKPCRRSMGHDVTTNRLNLRPSKECRTIHLCNYLICDNNSHTKLYSQYTKGKS